MHSWINAKLVRILSGEVMARRHVSQASNRKKVFAIENPKPSSMVFEIKEMLASGESPKTIAEELGVTLRTVKKYVKNGNR